VSCQPEIVTGYVDGALDASTRAEVEAHLADCEACRDQVLFETELRARLGTLPAPEPHAGFETRLRRRLQRERTGRFRLLLPVAASLIVAVLWGRGAAPFVAWELARDHVHCFSAKSLPAEIWSGDTSIVGAWFEKRGRILPYIPETAGGLELVGARLCPLADRRAGHLYYVARDRRVSLFVVPGSVRFNAPFGTKTRGVAVRLLRVSGTVVGIVGEAQEDVAAFESTFMTTVASAEAY